MNIKISERFAFLVIDESEIVERKLNNGFRNREAD